jgi:hypothetical protein
LVLLEAYPLQIKEDNAMNGRKSFFALCCVVWLLSVYPLGWADTNANHLLHAKVHTVAVPAETVMQITLTNPLDSKSAQLGDIVRATVKSPVYVGPYLAIQSGSTISGTITDINRTMQKDGPNPYLIVNFNQLNRPSNEKVIPITASLIAYKTGLQKEDYLWKLPQQQGKLKKRLGSAAEGAVVGFFVNPVIGPVIGAGAGVMKSMAIDKIVQHSSIAIKTGEVLSIAVQHSFKVPI